MQCRTLSKSKEEAIKAKQVVTPSLAHAKNISMDPATAQFK